jgi:tetratricopeptide (TPR) repeat protein
MSDRPRADNLAAIRELLSTAFTERKLRRFCRDRPAFRPVCDEFSESHGLSDLIDRLMEYCETQLLFEELLAEVKEANPRAYARFESEGQAPKEGVPEERAPASAAQRGVARWGIYALLSLGVLITVLELLGFASKGLRFLGGFADKPGVLPVAVVGLTLAILFAAGYVLLYRRQRPPVYGTHDRVVAGAVFLANVIVTLVLVFGVFRYDVVHAQPVSEGLLGIAVAEFGEGLDLKSSRQARELSHFVARAIRREIDLATALQDKVTVISVPLVRDEAEAEEIAREHDVSLIIWGWVSEEDTFVPSLTFVEPEDADLGLQKIPVWYQDEIRGDSTLELSRMFAERTASLIAYTVGLLHLSEDDYDRAAVEFQRAISQTVEMQDRPAGDEVQPAIAQTLAIYHLALGRTYAAQGDPEQARSEYDTAREYDAQYGPIYVGIGNLHYSAGAFEEALRWYEEAVRYVPEAKKATALYSRGNAHFYLEQYDAALADYELAIAEAEPEDKGLGLYHLVLGAALCELNRFPEAFEHLAQAEQLAGPEARLHADAEGQRAECEAKATAVSRAPETPTPVPPTPVPTLSPTDTPAMLPSPTATSTPQPSPRGTLSPTQSPTVTLQPLSTEPPAATSRPRPTSTPRPEPYPAPILLEPGDGAAFREGFTMRWQWSGTLKEDEWFDVRVWQGDEPHYGIVWVKEPTHHIDRWTRGEGEHFWAIAVIRGRDGVMEEQLSAESKPRLVRVLSSSGPPGPTQFPTRFPTRTAKP